MSTLKSSAENLTLNADGSGNDIKFQSNAVEKASIDQDGNVIAAGTISSTGDTTITNGDIVFATAAKGICLGVTTNTSSNTLDDYEEGTFSPRVQFGGATTGITYSSGYDTGFYTKIGNLVNFGFIVILSNNGSATGGAQISGLPFALNDVVYESITLSVALVNISFADQYWAYMPRNNTLITFRETTNAGTSTDITEANTADNSQFICSGHYITA